VKWVEIREILRRFKNIEYEKQFTTCFALVAPYVAQNAIRFGRDTAIIAYANAVECIFLSSGEAAMGFPLFLSPAWLWIHGKEELAPIAARRPTAGVRKPV
jgi:hypothetical protein